MSRLRTIWKRIVRFLIENRPLTDLWGDYTHADLAEIARLDQQIEDLLLLRSICPECMTIEGIMSIDRDIAKLQRRRDVLASLPSAPVMGA